MAFGQNYYPVETPEFLTLENGDYTAMIVSAVKKTNQNGDEYADLTVKIKGFDGYNPNHILLNEAPKLGAIKNNGSPVSKEDVDRANGKLTRFFKAFGIQDGNFNLQTWVNHVGTVHCDWQYDPNEPDKKSKKYKQLFPKVSGTTSAPPAQPAKPQSQSQQTSQPYTEDIPF